MTWIAVNPQPKHPTHIAPEGTIYVCGACGKTSMDIYGVAGGWDESCALNSVLCIQPSGPVSAAEC